MEREAEVWGPEVAGHGAEQVLDGIEDRLDGGAAAVVSKKELTAPKPSNAYGCQPAPPGAKIKATFLPSPWRIRGGAFYASQRGPIGRIATRESPWDRLVVWQKL